MAATVSVSDRAYCKILLHAAKYTHCAVNGVLLAERAKHGDTKNLRIVDTIPLFHLTLTLAPMMEIALTQIDAYCRSQGLVVGGYYQANEHYQQSRPNPIAYKIADKIHDNFSGSCLVMVENDRLSIECEEEAYRIYTVQDGKWKPNKDDRRTVQDETLAKASSLLQSKAYRSLVDFDTHLDDITKDWLNTDINDIIDHST